MNELGIKSGSQVNAEKAKISSRYENWFEATFEDPTIEYRIRSLRDDIFNGHLTTTGRKFSEIVVTPEELAEKGLYTFGQKEVSEYESEEAKKSRERTLDKGPLFKPKVVLKDIISFSQRENREEGLNRTSYQKAMQISIFKALITSGVSPTEALSLMAKSLQLATGEEWITADEWTGPNRLEEEEIELKLAKRMAEIYEMDLDELTIHHQRVGKINPSGPTYINLHDQHIVASSQGGLSQRPLSISSHWFEHAIAASDAGDVLLTLLGERELGNHKDSEALDKAIDFAFYAYQMNSQAAELLRGSIALSPSLSTKYILEKRKDVCTNAKTILDKTISLDQNDNLDILTEEDKEALVLLAERMAANRGTLEKIEVSDQEGEEEVLEEEDVLTPEEATALEKLQIAIELIDRDSAVNRLEISIDRLKRIGGENMEAKDINSILSLIKRLKNGKSALYLHDLQENEYKAILSLQEALDESILIDIAIPTKIKNVRPAWRYRLDLELMGDILINPYDDKGLEIRMLLDVLQEPVFERIFLTGPPPRRGDFSEEQLLDSFVSDKIYGDLRYPEILEGLVANNILDKYYQSLGIESKAEISKTMFPEKQLEQPPSALQNVDKAAEMVYQALMDNKKIATIGDCDQDGFFASINWRWVLEHVGVEKVEQKFNTRLEGHAVQTVDLLNLALNGNELIIVNDTGSSEQDTQTFSLIKNGARKVGDINFFRDNIELITGYEGLSEHEQRQIKTKLTRFINGFDDEESIDRKALLGLKFTTGETFINEEGKKENVYRNLGELDAFKQFVYGFRNLKIIVCDHHTPSIEATKYFKDNQEVIMVNPEWVREGYEDVFIDEMQRALMPDENGNVDIGKVNEAQRKYVCYPESDIVGTVTAGKVMKRFMQLLTDEEIVKTEEKELYSLGKKERESKYRELAEKVSNVSLYKNLPEEEGLPTYLKLSVNDSTHLQVFLGDLWLESNSMEKISSRITQIANSLDWRIREIKKEEDFKKHKLLLDDLEDKWNLSISNKKLLIDSIYNSSVPVDKDNLIETAFKKIEEIYDKRIETVLKENLLTKGELRFYLEYAGKLPQSFFTMSREEKREYVIPHLTKLTQEIEVQTYIAGEESPFTIELSAALEEVIENNGNLRDLKILLYDLIEKGYEENGGIPVNPRTNKIPARRPKVRYEGTKVWNAAIETLQERRELSSNVFRSLESYFNYGPYGLEFLKLTEATATLGDGGSVGIHKGLENRVIVKNGMEALEKFTDDYWEADEEHKKSLKRVQPEILRLIRTSLRGTHIKSVNWHLSRLLTHGVSAFVNAMYRRGKEERSQRAKEFWSEASDFCVRRSDNENTRRHRYTLAHAQEVSIERREELFEEIVKELENDHGEIEKPIIITKLEGLKYVDPIKGLRGLIAGQLSSRYNKPSMVVVEERAETKGSPARYSVSFRLPAKGNVATDMVQLGLAINPVPGIEIIAHGGHPEAAGGTWEVTGGIEKIHEVLDPIFSNFKVENPDAGIVKMEEVIQKTTQELQKDGWDALEDYEEHINTFNIADTVAANMYKQTNPYGVGMPGLVLEFDDLTIVNKSKGTKNDGDEYCNLKVRDKRGNVKNMRLFKELADLNEIEKGDKVSLRAQPIMRLRALEEGNLQYNWPLPDNPNERIEVNTIVGPKSRPHLDIEKVLDIKKNPQDSSE